MGNHILGEQGVLRAVRAAVVGVALLGTASCITIVPTGPAPANPPVPTRAPTQAAALTRASATALTIATPTAAAKPTAVPTTPAKPAPTAPVAQPSGDRGVPADAALFAGAWRTYSTRLIYDKGGGGPLGGSGYTSQNINLTPDGGWQFGSSSGRWSVAPIGAADWTNWGASPYGPTRKITWQGWNGSTADGPIEEVPGRINFLWVIYRVGPPTVEAPGTVELKYGHQ